MIPVTTPGRLGIPERLGDVVIMRLHGDPPETAGRSRNAARRNLALLNHAPQMIDLTLLAEDKLAQLRYLLSRLLSVAIPILAFAKLAHIDIPQYLWTENNISELLRAEKF